MCFYSEMSNDKLIALLDDYLNVDGTGMSTAVIFHGKSTTAAAGIHAAG